MLPILAILMHAVPIASLVAFFAIENVATATLVQASYFSAMPLFVFDLSDPLGALANIAEQAKRAAFMLSLAEGRYLLTGLIVLGLVLGRPPRKVPPVLLAFVAALYWGAFSLIALLPRYFMPVLPFLCIAATKRVCAYVEENHAGGRVVAHWPLSLYLAFPELGYVDSRAPGIVAHAGDRVDMLIHSSMSAERTGRLRKCRLRVGGRIGLEIELEVVERR